MAPGRGNSPTGHRGQPASGGLGRLIRSPLVLITTAAIAIGVIVLVVNMLLGTTSATGRLVDPAEPAPAALATARTLGQADAKVTIDLYADYQCPNCAAYAAQVEPRLVNQYVRAGSARMVFHDMAFLGSGSDPSKNESIQAAVAARCAEDQGKFWAYQEYLFANQGPVENGGTFKRSLFDSIADRLGLNRTAFDTCLVDPAKTAAVQADTEASIKSGIKGTPTLVVNGTMLTSWGLDAASAAIDAALAAAGPSPSLAPAASAAP
jgi:protein-disulfide isomerase